jgi:hypothetical protein
MNKRRPSLHPDQLGFTFEAPRAPARVAGLVGIEAQIAAAVGIALKDDPRSREEIAGAMSALMADEVSRWMLDGYSSEARDKVNISFGRFLALIVVTARFDLLDALMRRGGLAVLQGEEIALARVGHLRSSIDALKAELKVAEALAHPLERAK